MSATIYSLASAGHVKSGVLAACDRLGLCDAARRDCVNRAMHSLRTNGSPAMAVKAGRDLARQLASAAVFFNSKEPA